MRLLDSRTIAETGVPGVSLMRNAGQLAASAVLEYIHALAGNGVPVRNIVFLAGKGNNGGDAFVAAKTLFETGEFSIFLHCMPREESLSQDAFTVFGELPEELKKRIKYSLTEEDLSRPGTLIVDGLLGTGFRGELKDDCGKWIFLANASGHHIVSLDIPSGMEADTGKSGAHAIEADLTLTMANPKKGMLSPEGALLCGRIQVLDIGIPGTFADEIADFEECTVLSDVKKSFPKEKADIHKYERGHVLVLGGSCLYSGAPLLAGEAAARTGAGLVSIAVPGGTLLEGRMIPRALMIRKTGGKGFFSASCWEEIGTLAEKADVIVVGPGMGTNGESIPFLRNVLRSGKRVLADADALNLLAGNPELFRERTCEELVLTPHEGEMRRLEKALSLDSTLPREERARRLAAKVRAFVILKGVRSIVCTPEGKTAVNLSGSPALATAGSGDVLAGICGALLLEKDPEPFTALRAAVFLHGLAGELADPSGSRGVLADDLLERIAPAMRKISPRA